jgi:hypothetical protein
MRQEANPRKFLRRALDYGASPVPITVSHFDSPRTAFAAFPASCTSGPRESSKSDSHAAKSIASEIKSKTHVTHSKQTTATQINRYFLSLFPLLPTRSLSLAKCGFTEGFFPAITARAI